MVRDDRPGYWRATRRLMGATLALWLLFGPVGWLIARHMSGAELFGMPFGYLLSALGLPVALVGTAFWFADRQDRIDRDHGMAEED